MKLGKHEINDKESVFIVAEAGINHNGDIKIAKKMIEAAAKCGADAVKFQTIFTEELFSEVLNPEVIDFANKVSFNKKQHLELMKHATKCGIEFFSTPVGKKSAELLDSINVKSIKIASGEITNHEMIKKIAKMGKPMIISTGMTTISEIADVVKIVKSNNCPFILLHCNASYPTPIEDANLNTIPYLHSTFDVPIGYSDHTIGNESCLVAVSLGACVIEKHFTLDKKMDGPDQKLSADTIEFTELVSKIRTVEKALGIHRTEPTQSEKKFKKLMRKSIGTAINIKKGTKIKRSMLSIIRPETGISPVMLDKIIGMTITKDAQKGTILTWDMF